MLFVIVCCVKQGLISSEEKKKILFFRTIDVKNYVEKNIVNYMFISVVFFVCDNAVFLLREKNYNSGKFRFLS